MAAQQLMKKGKRQLAVYIKSQCLTGTAAAGGVGYEHLKCILDHLLDPHMVVESPDRFDWCRTIMAGGTSFEEFAATVRSYDNATTCGFVWTSDYVAYRCRTCGLSPCMSLCSDCFLAADHSGHDFNMFRSQAGGACDCGDASVMKPLGFCSRHQPERANQQTAAPHELLAVAELMMPCLICRLLQHLRDPSAHVDDESYTVILPETDHFLDFLQQLSDMGAAMRTVITKTVCDPDLYRKFCEESSGPTGTQANYKERLQSLKRVPVPEAFRSVLGLDGPLVHTCLLDELFFWMLKYEFPQKVVTLLLSLLPDEIYKASFIQTFVKHYPYVSIALVNTKDKPRMSNSVVHISVQLLSPVQLATQMVTKHNLLHVMLICLMHMMDSILMGSSDSIASDANPQIVDCSTPIMRDHSYWPIVSDIINVFSHRYIVVDYFLSNRDLLSYWAKIIACFQGMNLNIREMMQHVEYEPESYYAAFSAELEICASPMWALLQHLEDESAKDYTKNVIEIFSQQLHRWFISTNTGIFIKPQPNHLSFHYPLHRYLSVFIHSAIVKQGMSFRELNLSQEFLQLLMIHPLQLLVGFHEIFAGLWVRNGLQIRGQAMTYLQCHFCNSTIDADFFLLQIISSQLDADHFIQTVLERFHVLDCLTFQSNSEFRGHSFLARDQEMPMLEAMLSFLCMLLSIRTYSGEMTQDVTRQEMVALLCMSDRTHSQLIDSFPEKCGLSGQAKDFEQVLKTVSDYREPVYEHGGSLQQGKYVPTADTWVNLYDPLHVLLRSLHRRDFQASIDRYTEHVKQHKLFKGSSNVWPPFRIPGPLHPAFIGLTKLLHCRTMHGLIFVLLHKAVSDPNIPDAIIFYTVYLLELALTLPNPDGNKREIYISTKHKDKEFCNWFSSSNIFLNLMTVIPHMMVSYYRRKEMEMSVDISVRHNHFDDVLGPSSSSASGVFWTMVPASQNQSSDGSNASPNLMALQIFDSTLLAISESSQLDVVPAAGAEEKQVTPKYRHQGISANLDQEQVVEQVMVDQSILSLLLKLHSKLLGKSGAYLPFQNIGGNDVWPLADSRVGDGEYFVRKILDTICLKNEDCRHCISVMTSSQSETSKASSESNVEENRRKAKEKQDRVMKSFLSKQRVVMETMFGSDIESPSTEEADAVKQSVFHCCICGQQTASLDSRPVGLTALIQSSSVLGHRRHCSDPVQLHLSDPLPHINNTAKEFRKRLVALKNDFEEGSWMMALNGGWQGGVHVQTCGHYLHLDCHRSYISSLKNVNQQQSQILQVQLGEFLCPVCRQLSNTVLPIPPTSAVGASTVPEQFFVRHIADLLLAVRIQPVDSPLTNAMKSVMQDLTNATYPQYRLFAQGSSIPNLLMFIGSLLRANLEMELVLQSSSQTMAATANLAQKKSCIFPLFHVLSMHYKIGMTKPRTDLWSHITGVNMEEKSTSVSLYTKEVPLMLKDVCTMLIQLVLSLPPEFSKSVYSCVVQALYNVQLVQAVIIVSCKFSTDEHEAWRLKGHRAGCSQLEALMTFVIESLSQCAIYADLETPVPAICQSVWSPLSVEENVLDHLLPFLRLSAQLRQHLFDEELPAVSSAPMQEEARRLLRDQPPTVRRLMKNECRVKGNRAEFELLVTFLGLAQKGSSAVSKDSGLICTSCLRWFCDNHELLVQGWCRHLVQALGQHPSSLRSLLTVNPTWYPPQLLQLPKSYDQIFQFYRKKECIQCRSLPKSPALCLVCGQLICYKEECCQRNNTMESVQHSIDCGGGAGIFLIVNSSIIIIIRGPRAAIWGSVYLDKHGEEDRDLKRGKPLHLNEDRFRLLHQLWITHSFDHICKQWILHNNQL